MKMGHKVILKTSIWIQSNVCIRKRKANIIPHQLFQTNYSASELLSSGKVIPHISEGSGNYNGQLKKKKSLMDLPICIKPTAKATCQLGFSSRSAHIVPLSALCLAPDSAGTVRLMLGVFLLFKEQKSHRAKWAEVWESELLKPNGSLAEVHEWMSPTVLHLNSDKVREGVTK